MRLMKPKGKDCYYVIVDYADRKKQKKRSTKKGYALVKGEQAEA